MTLASEIGETRLGQVPKAGRRRIRMGLLLGLRVAGLLLPLVALEVVFRTLGPVLPGHYRTGYYLTTDPIYGRFHIRSFGGWTKAPEYTTYLRTNQLGLRGPEVMQPKPADVYRVLVLGDSFVEAAQVAEDQAFTQRLE